MSGIKIGANLDPLKIESLVSFVSTSTPVQFGPFAHSPPTDLLSRKEAAIFLSSFGCRISPRQLEKWACGDCGKPPIKGPPFTKLKKRGGRAYYLVADLRTWAQAHMRRGE